MLFIMQNVKFQNSYTRKFHILRKHFFRPFGPPPPPCKHILCSENKQFFSFSFPLPSWKCLRNIWIVPRLIQQGLKLHWVSCTCYYLTFQATLFFSGLPKKKYNSMLYYSSNFVVDFFYNLFQCTVDTVILYRLYSRLNFEKSDLCNNKVEMDVDWI